MRVQRVKGQLGKPGVARDEAIKIRQATLKPQLQSRGKDNLFKDRRIGQHDKAGPPRGRGCCQLNRCRT